MRISTMLKDLYGINDYWKHIKVGDELWTDYVENITHIKWNKIKITYIRSGVMFYNIIDFDDVERYIPLNCFATSVMYVAKLDPHKDLAHIPNIDKYSFTTEHTEVVNFDNSEKQDDLSDLYLL